MKLKVPLLCKSVFWIIFLELTVKRKKKLSSHCLLCLAAELLVSKNVQNFVKNCFLDNCLLQTV